MNMVTERLMAIKGGTVGTEFANPHWKKLSCYVCLHPTSWCSWIFIVSFLSPGICLKHEADKLLIKMTLFISVCCVCFWLPSLKQNTRWCQPHSVLQDGNAIASTCIMSLKIFRGLGFETVIVLPGAGFKYLFIFTLILRGNDPIYEYFLRWVDSTTS